MMGAHDLSQLSNMLSEGAKLEEERVEQQLVAKMGPGDIGPKKQPLPPPEKPKDPKAIWDEDEVRERESMCVHFCSCLYMFIHLWPPANIYAQGCILKLCKCRWTRVSCSRKSKAQTSAKNQSMICAIVKRSILMTP